jgi:hypothetical protein
MEAITWSLIVGAAIKGVNLIKSYKTENIINELIFKVDVVRKRVNLLLFLQAIEIPVLFYLLFFKK